MLDASFFSVVGFAVESADAVAAEVVVSELGGFSSLPALVNPPDGLLWSVA